ncbi:hypothetical protein JCM3774_003090 [Rhodotorula dairenensis]
MGVPLRAGPTPPRLPSRLRRTPSPPPTTDWTLSDVQSHTVSINSPLYGFAPEVAAMIAPSALSSSSSAASSIPARRTPPNAAAMRALDARLDEAMSNSDTSAPSSAGIELQEQRRMLDEVRDRLEETRQRIAAATAYSRAEEHRGSPALVAAQDALSRDIRFASRVDILAHTLNSIAERTMSLSSAIESLRASSPPTSSPRARPDADSTLARLPFRATPSTSFATGSTQDSGLATLTRATSLEEDATHTDDIRSVVRQLVLMSRRVAAVIAQHREQVATSAANLPPAPEPTSAARSPSEGLSMREQLPVILPSYLHERPLPPDTTPNLDGLLLPQTTVLGTTAAGHAPELSTSPQPMSSPSSPPPPDGTGADRPDSPGESYPGERMQLMRIAQLQSDIAARAGQLRALRARGRELGRTRRESEVRTAIPSFDAGRGDSYGDDPAVGQAGGEGDGEKEDDEPRDGLAQEFETASSATPPSPRRDHTNLRRRTEVHGWSRQDPHGTPQPVSAMKQAVDAIRNKQDYELWRQCGR